MKLLAAKQVTLGFIGLGNMGSRIAQRLLDRGYALTVYDQDDTKAEALALNGAAPANDIAELAQNVDVILSCLTNDDAVQNVYAGPEGALAVARPGTVVLEMSTISPASSRQLHNQAAKLGIEVMDVAISGSTPAAGQGTLTLLAGGNAPLRLMNKDFQLILNTAAEENVPMPVTETAFRVNADELALGEEQDFSAVMRRMEELAGVGVTHSTP